MRWFRRSSERPSIQDISKTGSDGITRQRSQIVREWHKEIQSNITNAREKLDNLDSLDPEVKIEYRKFLTVIEKRARAYLAEARRSYYARFTAPFTTDQEGHNKRANASVILKALVPKSQEILNILQQGNDIKALVPKSQEILDILQQRSDIKEGRVYLQKLQQPAQERESTSKEQQEVMDIEDLGSSSRGRPLEERAERELRDVGTDIEGLSTSPDRDERELRDVSTDIEGLSTSPDRDERELRDVGTDIEGLSTSTDRDERELRDVGTDIEGLSTSPDRDERELRDVSTDIEGLSTSTDRDERELRDVSTDIEGLSTSTERKRILARLKQVNEETLPRIKAGLANLERLDLPPAAEVNLQHRRVMRELVPHSDVSNALKPYRDMSEEDLTRERHGAEQRRAELSRERRDLLMKDVNTDDDEKRLNVIKKEQYNIENKITKLEVEISIREAIPDSQARENARALRDRRLTVIDAIKWIRDDIKWISEELGDNVIDSIKIQLNATCATAKELLTKANELMPKPLERPLKQGIEPEVFETARRNFRDQISADSLGQPTKPDERSAARDLFAQKLKEKGGVVFDIDETLIDRTRGEAASMIMPKNLIKAIERFVNYGRIRVGFISGRTAEYIVLNLQLGGATQNFIDGIDIYGEYGNTHKGPDTNGKIIRLKKDTTDINLSKGTAVAFLVKRWGSKSVVVFGDDIPDLAMDNALLRLIAGNQHVGDLSPRENRRELLEKSISRPTAQDETFAPTGDQIRTRFQLNNEFLSLHKSPLEFQAFVGVKHPQDWPTEDAIIKASTFMLENPDDAVAFVEEIADEITAPSELKGAVKTGETDLEMAASDPDLAVHTDVSNYRDTLASAMSYLQSDVTTTEGLIKMRKALEAGKARVDDLIEDRIREDVNKCSEDVKDIKRFQPEPFELRNFKVEDILDFPQLAEDFQDALEQQEQPEKIYRELQSLQREPEAINKLDTEYWKNHQKTLETALRERFDKPGDHPGLEYALQLINKGKSEAEQAIWPILALDEPQHISERFNQTLKGVSKHINQALEGNQPEDVCTKLTAFERNTYLVSQLGEAYQEEYGTDLHSAIGQKLQRSAFTYARYLMGDQAKKQVVSQNGARRLEKMLLINLEISNVARRINQALENGHPETVYAALTPFERNTELLCKLGEAYQKEYGTDLHSAIGQKLQRGAFTYARYLMGDEVLEKEVIRSLKEAVALQKALSELTFDRDDGMRVLVPYGGDSEPGVHIMCQVVKGMGYKSRKCFAHSRRTDEYGLKHPNLYVRTNFAPDMLPGQEPTNALESRVALLIEVKTSLDVRELVLGSSGALSVKDWLGTMSQDPVKRISLDEFKDKLDVRAQLNLNFPNPADETCVFTASRNYFYLPTSGTIAYLQSLENQPDNKTIADFSAREAYNDSGKRVITDQAAWMPCNGIARFIRENMQFIHDDASAERFLNAMATDFLKKVNTFHSKSIAKFDRVFPNLSQELQAHMEARNVSIPTRERLERLLSGDYAPSGIRVDLDQSAFFGHSIYSGENNNIFLQPPNKKLASAESQFHKMMDLWLLEAIRGKNIGKKEISEIEDAFDCSRNLDMMRRCFSGEEVNNFVERFSIIRQGIRQGITEIVLLGNSADKVQQFKQRIIKDILEVANAKKKAVNSYRNTHLQEVKQIEKYFNICADNLQDCISEIKKCSSDGSNFDIVSQKANNLSDSIIEAEKAMKIIDLRKRCPTARGILDAHSLPEKLVQWHANFSSRVWKEISKERAEREFGRKITDEEFNTGFQQYYEEYLRELDQHALDLVAPEDTEICIRRRPHKLLEILECGRIKSMFETQTVGGEHIGSKHQAYIEQNLYGFPLNYPDEVRPLYTSVTNGSYAPEASQHWGAAAIKLKPSVQQRATKIMYDSGLLSGDGFITARPVPFNELGRNCFPLADPESNWSEDLTLEEKMTIATTPHKKDPLKFKTANDIRPWLEGQIHGGLTIDDIERVDFTEHMDFELKREFDKKIDDSQEAYWRKLLGDACNCEEHEIRIIIKSIKREGLTVLISRDMLTKQIDDRIRTKLEKIHQERSEDLERLVKEQKEILKKLLEERGIAYSFHGDSTE